MLRTKKYRYLKNFPLNHAIAEEGTEYIATVPLSAIMAEADKHRKVMIEPDTIIIYLGLSKTTMGVLHNFLMKGRLIRASLTVETLKTLRPLETLCLDSDSP